MTLNYTTSVINDRLTAVASDIDAANPLPGQIRLLNATNQTVSLVTLSLPCGSVLGGVLTFTTPANGATLISGNITAADIENGSGTVVASGLTVGGSTSFDIVMANTAVTAPGQIVSLTYAAITGR